MYEKSERTIKVMTQGININQHPSKDQILLLFLCNKAVGFLAVSKSITICQTRLHIKGQIPFRIEFGHPKESCLENKFL